MAQTSAQEIKMKPDDFIVSKTDAKGKITYCNRIFIQFSGYDEAELLGQPHNIIRHPDMPRSVYRFMWQTLQEGDEFFGYVKNRCKNGQYYWVLANVTPSYDADDKLLGYYSVRRCPQRSAIELIEPLYQRMIEEESQHTSAQQAMDASFQILNDFVEESGKAYNELILKLEN
ncbi:MAG: PAS domain-containing protein [Gammaproteobacteria bacterium]|nr:PAS domain-containing protein [Gammaproteobacteria bacterium]